MRSIQRFGSRLRAALAPGVLLVILCAARPAVAQNIVINGDFESPNVGADIVRFEEGANFGGWTVESGSVDLTGTVLQVASGGQSVDLNGNQRGAIFQDVANTSGRVYILRFALAGNTEGGPKVKQVEV